MNTATITIKTNATTKANAQKLADKLGVNLTFVIENYLKQFIRTKGADIKEEPNEYLIKSLKQSEADIKAGRVISFASGKEALEYLDNEILKRKRKRATH